MNTTVNCVARTCLTVALAVSSFGQTITSLGVLPGGTMSEGQAVNADGTVVVGFGNATGSGAQIFRWTPSGGPQPLGFLPGGDYSYGHGVSFDGGVVSGRSESTNGDNAVRWTQAGGLQDLGVGPGGFDAVGYGTNGDGSVITGFVVSPSYPAGAMFRWTQASGTVALGHLPSGNWSLGYAVSADGSTIVGYSNYIVNNPLRKAVRWTQAGGVQDLGFTPGDNSAEAHAVNADGSIIAGYHQGSVPGHACRWVSGILENLGTLPGDSFSFARAISQDGQVVAGFGPSGAMIWTPTFGMEKLHDYLPQQGVNLTGWQLAECYGISADGKALVGTGFFNGQIRGWVVRNIPPVCGPRITAHPQSVIGCAGGQVSMFCDAFNIGGLHLPGFQWQKRQNDGEWNDLPNFTSPFGTIFSGTNSPMITVSNCGADAPGLYRCMVTGGCAPRASAAATVSLINVAPFFSVQPQDVYACPSDTVVYSAGPFSAGGQPYTFEWERETFANSGVYVFLSNGSTLGWDGNLPGRGAIVSGTSTGLLTIAPDLGNGRLLGPGHARHYRCVVSNPCGTAVSVGAGLKVWTSCTQADVNCDDVVTVSDIGSFVLLLTNRPAYEEQNPDCNPANGDLNDDGIVSVSDIGPFVSVLTGG